MTFADPLRREAVESAAIALYGRGDLDPSAPKSPDEIDVDFGPFDLDDALRFEEERRDRSVFFGDLLGAALVAGAAMWSVAASLG